VSITRYENRLLSNYLRYHLSYEGDIGVQVKITNFVNVTGIINSVFKPNLVQKHSRLRIYVLAKPTSVYGGEAWTIKEQDEK
jgi:hypothetical protein